MKLYQKFLILSRGKQIAAAVCVVHLLSIFGLGIHHVVSRQLKPPRPMAVKMYRAAPAVQSVQVGSVKVEGKKSVVKKSETVAKVSKKPVSTVKPKPPENHLLKEIEESFGALRSEALRSRPPLQLPTMPESSPPAPLAPTYGEFLIGYLQTALDLPEYGEVRARIEIDRFGRLIDCEILEAKSAKNGEFLKKELPNLTFPCLNDFDIIDPTQTFTITFRNVETR